MLKVLFKRGQVVINSRIRFFQIGFFQQLSAAGADQYGRRQFASSSILQHESFDVRGIKCPPVICLSDGMNHILTPVEMRKVDDPSQMCGDFDRLTPQLEVKVSGLVTECIECFLNLMSSHSTSQLQCCKAMFRQAETLVAVIASSVAGH